MKFICTAAIKNNAYRIAKRVFLILTFVVFSGCTHLLYQPDRFLYVNPENIKPYAPREIKILIDENNSNEFLYAWYFSSLAKKKKGVVVHFHGNAQNLSTHFIFFKWLTEYGYDYVIFDYRGFGLSSDEYAEPSKTVKDGIEFLKYIKDENPDLPIIAIGQSLGSNVLLRASEELNAREETKKYVPSIFVFESSFLSYRRAARSVLQKKWFLYPIIPFTYLAIDDRWSAQSNMENIPKNIPAIYFHSVNDGVIGFELGIDNFNQWPGPKVFFRQDDSGHIGAFGTKTIKAKNQILLLRCLDKSIAGDFDQFAECEK